MEPWPQMGVTFQPQAVDKGHVVICGIFEFGVGQRTGRAF